MSTEEDRRDADVTEDSRPGGKEGPTTDSDRESAGPKDRLPAERESRGEEDRDEEIDKMQRVRDEEPDKRFDRDDPAAPSVGDVFRAGT